MAKYVSDQAFRQINSYSLKRRKEGQADRYAIETAFNDILASVLINVHDVISAVSVTPILCRIGSAILANVR